MDFIEIAREILRQIKNNAAIDQWAKAQYGKGITCFLGIGSTTATMPSEEHVPFVIITEGTVIRGKAGNPESASITLGWDVIAQGQQDEDGIRILTGSTVSNDLGELIVDAIEQVTAYYTVDSIEVTPATTEEWGPRFPGIMTINLTLR